MRPRLVLRPLTQRSLKRYPETPIVYSRPFLRGYLGIGYVLTTWLSLYLAVVPTPGDPVSPYLMASMPLTFGSAYLYVAGRLEVDRSHVRIRNPFRRVDVPLALITKATPGSNLKIETADRRYYAWTVEAANIQLHSDDSTQAQIAAIINATAESLRARDVEEAPASPQYRFSFPDALYSICTLGILLAAIITART